MKGMNISRNAFIGEINSQDIATEREQPHNGTKNFMHLTKKILLPYNSMARANLNELCEKYYCSTKVVHTVKSRAIDRSTIQFLILFGVLLTKTCYYSRRATIVMSSN